MPPQPNPHVAAAIDIGSTSVHLLVARAGGSASPHAIEPLVDLSDILGLGERVDAAGALGAAATDSLATTLERFLALAADHGALSTAIVATEPLRRAADAEVVISGIARRIGRTIGVLTPDEEALCTLVGVTRGRRLVGETAVVDVGGGSTEVVVASPRNGPRSFSVATGAIRLTSTLDVHDPPTRAEVAALRTAALDAFAGVPTWRLESLVAVGGTATNLGRIASALGTGTTDTTLTLDDVEAVVQRLMSEPAERVALDAGIRPARARILPAGAAILEVVLERCGLGAVTLSAASLREGLVLLVSRAGDGWRDGLDGLVRGWE